MYYQPYGLILAHNTDKKYPIQGVGVLFSF